MVLTAFFFFSDSAFFSALRSALSASASSFSWALSERVPIFSLIASAPRVSMVSACNDLRDILVYNEERTVRH